jgi:hypothetical protein
MKPLFEFGKRAQSSFLDPNASNRGYTAVGAAQGVMHRKSFIGNRVSASGASGTQVDRFSPPQEGLDRDSLMDDITPRSTRQLFTLFDKIRKTDSVAGTAVDMIRTFPWSDGTLSGVKDPDIMRLFSDAFDLFNPVVTMPDIHGDYLTFGHSIATMIFSSDTQTWSDVIPWSPMDCTLHEVPIRGRNPLVDVATPAAMMKMLTSKDKRFDMHKSVIPDKLAKALKAGKAELDPLTTMFVPRRANMTDWTGTSIFWRILPYVAIEKALLQSTISNARRRTRSILHIQAGVDNVWEPDDDEMSRLTTLFLQSEEDPAGAVIVTRNGVNANEVRSGSDHWKVSDEADFLRAGKLNGLNMSDAILSGEANFNTMDATLTLFVESQKISRTHLTNEVLYRMLFAQIARAHGLIKSNSAHADAAHGVRTHGRRLALASPLSIDEAMKIPFKDLMMPVIHWTKSLAPNSDQAYMDILEKVEQKGIPIPVSMWASSAGLDLQQLKQALPEDKATRAFLKKYVVKPEGDAGGFGGGGGAFGSSNDRPNQFIVDDLGLAALASIVGYGPDNTILGVRVADAYDFLESVTLNNREMLVLSDWNALQKKLSDTFGSDGPKVESMKFILSRSGYTKCPIDTNFLTSIATAVAECANDPKVSKERLKMLKSELNIIGTIFDRSMKIAKHNNPAFYEAAEARIRVEAAQLSAKRVVKSFTGQQDNLAPQYLYSGLTPHA